MKEIKTIDELNEVLKNNKNVVVDFSATWCGPCKMLAPVLEEVSQSNTHISFYGVNVDEGQDLAREFQIMYVPTLIFFKNGQKVFQDSGFKDDVELNNLFNQYFN